MKKLFFVSLVMLAITPFFLANAISCPTGTAEDNGICVPNQTGLPDPPNGVLAVVLNVMDWLVTAFAAVAIIGFVISGMQYLLSAGDDKLIATAKRNMIYCIIGVVIGLAGIVIITAIDNALNNRPF
jgi:hypothetical protein